MNETRQSLLFRAQAGETDAWNDLAKVKPRTEYGIAGLPSRAPIQARHSFRGAKKESSRGLYTAPLSFPPCRACLLTY
jgi:hypothetical protein